MESSVWNNLKMSILQMPGYAWLKDSKGNYVACNDAFGQIMNISKNEIINKTDYDLAWYKEAKSIQQSDLQILSNKKVQIVEEITITKHNTTVVLLISKSIIQEKQNALKGIIGIAFDITNYKKEETLLKNIGEEANLALVNILDNIPAHIFWKDRNCILLGCNNLQAKNMGFTSGKEMIGKSNYDVIWPHQSEEAKRLQANAITKIDLEVMKTGKEHVVEEPLILPDGSTAIYLSKKTPLRNSQGKIVGLLGISFDITEQKKIAQELIEARNKLEGMTLVSASMAHEIRTPLATVNFRAKYVQRNLNTLIEVYQKALSAGIKVPKIDNKDLEELKKSFNVIERETLGVNTLLEMMLMNLQPKFEETKVISISHCIEEALDRYPFQGDERTRVDWEKSQDFKIKGSPLLLVHVLFNLLKNALYYTHHKGDISIRLEPAKDTSFSKLYFKDTGKGIPPDILPYIFEQFFSKTHHGAGIGLTFCKLVMESLGGSISCESEEGSYTQFILSFPKLNE